MIERQSPRRKCLAIFNFLIALLNSYFYFEVIIIITVLLLSQTSLIRNITKEYLWTLCSRFLARMNYIIFFNGDHFLPVISTLKKVCIYELFNIHHQEGHKGALKLIFVKYFDFQLSNIFLSETVGRSETGERLWLNITLASAPSWHWRTDELFQ